MGAYTLNKPGFALVELRAYVDLHVIVAKMIHFLDNHAIRLFDVIDGKYNGSDVIEQLKVEKEKIIRETAMENDVYIIWELDFKISNKFYFHLVVF